MQRKIPLTFVLFEEPITGNEPVRDWFKSLDKADRKIIGHDVLFLQYNWPIGKPHVDNLGKGLWELRSKLSNTIARVIFIVRRDKIIALHAFIKKTPKTPPSEIKIALKRSKEVEY